MTEQKGGSIQTRRRVTEIQEKTTIVSNYIGNKINCQKKEITNKNKQNKHKQAIENNWIDLILDTIWRSKTNL